jgi:hypothetical protein
MNKDVLSGVLARCRVPERPDDYWDAFPARVIRSLRAGATPGTEPRRSGLLIGILAAAAGALAMFSLSLLTRQPTPAPPSEVLRDGRLLGAMLVKFPGRLRAVTRDRAGIHSIVSSTADVATSDPVWLEIHEVGGDRVIATFSGQKISTESGDAIVLVDRSGHVMLVGDAFFWSQDVSAGLPGDVRLRASQIPAPDAANRTLSPL